MKKQLLFASLLLFLLFGALSCKDKKNKKSYCTENPGNCQSVLAAKDFFLFKEGSWWVYEEETSHERDSVFVTQYYNSNGYDFDMRVKSSLTDYEYHYYPFFAGGNNSCSESGPVAGKCIYIKRSKGKPGDYIGEDYCFFVNFKVGDWIYISNVDFENDKISIESISDNHVINDLNFNQTVKVHELATFIETNQPTNHYFSKGVGLIRKELLDSNQIWNLISYHIEQ